jgi:pimeloyl-ACP methyl ester carboxylesterase
MVSRNRLAEGVGLIAGVAALAMGGVAMGLELERRIVSKRIDRSTQSEIEEFFSLRSDGPDVTTADGVVLHTEVDEGPAADFTLVWVHGYALNMDCWHFQRKHFRGSVRQVLYDLRSHGRSTRSAADHCRLDQLAIDLEQILDEVVGDGPVVLIGHSMGGMTIMRLAQTRPELFGSRVVGVGLLHTSAGHMADHSPIRGLPGRTFSRVAEPLMASLNRIPELVEGARRAGSDLGYVVTRRMAFASDVPAGYIEFVSEMLAGTPLEVVADFYPAFDELDEYAALAGIGVVPTVVVGGEDDMFTPVAHLDKITEQLPDAVSLRLPKCGHLGMIEHHEAVNEVLDDLLDRVREQLGLPGR